MSTTEGRRLRLAAPGIFALEQLEQVDREIAALPRILDGRGEPTDDIKAEAVQEVLARAMQALIMEGTGG